MYHSKLLELVRKLDGYQLNRLEDFLQSPYFNKNETIQQLFQLVRAGMEAEASEALDKEQIFGLLFPGKKFQPARLNYLANQLFQLTEQFLKTEGISLSEEFRLLQFFTKHGLEKHYQQKDKQISQSIEAINYQDEHYFYLKFEQAKIEDQHFLSQGQRKYDPHIQTASQQLDRFYLIQKLKFYAEMLDREKKLPPSYAFTDLKLLDQLIEATQAETEDYIQLHRKLIQMLLDENHTPHYDAYLQQLEESKAVIEPTDLKRLYFYAINYCVRKIASGQNFQQNLLELYMTGLEEGFLFQNNGQLSPWTYKNIVQLALAQQQQEWAEAFIHGYAPKLPGNYQKDAFHYNLAVLYYMQKSYDEAMYYLNQVNYTNLSFKLWSREMLLKIYFEEGEEEALFSLIISFETLIRRNKTLSRKQKSSYSNFLKLTSKLLKRRVPIEKIQQEIQETAALRERKWLLEQCQKKIA